MYNQMFENLLSQSKPLPEYVVKTNKLMVESLEKVTAFQMEALKSYVDLGLERARAATEVQDPKSLQNFVNGQMEVAKVLREKLVADSKAMAELGNGFKADFEKLTKEGMSEVSKATKSAPRKAAA